MQDPEPVSVKFDTIATCGTTIQKIPNARLWEKILRSLVSHYMLCTKEIYIRQAGFPLEIQTCIDERRNEE
jgi:hypothetical protein